MSVLPLFVHSLLAPASNEYTRSMDCFSHVARVFRFSMRDFAEEDVKPRLFRKPVNRGSHDWRRTFSLDFSFPFVRLLASGYWVS